MGRKLILGALLALISCTIPLAKAPPHLGASITTNWSQDLAGSTYSSQTVSGIQTHAVAAPTTAGALEWNGSAWVYSSGLPAGPCGADLATSGGNCGAVQSITPTGGTSTVVPFNAGGLKASTSPWVLQDSGAVTRFSLETTHGRGTFGGGGTDFSAVVGPVPTAETVGAGIWALPNATAASASNYVFQGDGVNGYYNTVGASGFHQWRQANGAGIAQLNGTAFNIGATSTAAPVSIIYIAPTTPFIQAGTSVTSLGIGTNKAGATLNLQADAAGTVITLSGGASLGNTAIEGSIQVTTRTITSNLTVDTTTTDYEIIADTSGGPITVTLPTPTNGRQLILIDKKSSFGTNNLTLARHGSEKINNVAASKVLSSSGGRWTITSDGTDWYL